MSKNSTLADTAISLANSTKDENFKDIIRYKAIAALLVKLTIPEFNNKSIIEIAKLIIDRRNRNEKISSTSILEDEVDFLPTEIGTKDEKNTLNDAIFQIRTDTGISNIRLGSVHSKITVNTEMQNTTSETILGYNLISRAIYYGASLFRSTVPSGDTKYSNIHKVYSIWFCNGNIKFDTNYDAIKNEYIHRYGMRRFYSNVPNQVVPAEKASDLIEVVIVELKKLKEHLDKDTERLVYDLFYDTSSVVGQIENIEKVNLTKVKKGVQDMIDYETRTQERVDEAILSLAKNAVDNYYKTHKEQGYTKIIESIANLLNLNEETIVALKKEYKV